MNAIEVIKSKWWVFVLLLILLYSYNIRSINIVPDRILSFDPVYYYRFTRYMTEFGHLPVWDELTYYVGKISDAQLFMPLVTSTAYQISGMFTDASLLTVASYMSAIYGALIVIAAFLLGRELSNKYGGLVAAALAGSAPQILVRTFGGSYDTDQLVLFFLLLTLYLGFYALRKKNIASVSIAIAGFAGFMLLWQYFLYSFVMLVISLILYVFLELLPKHGVKLDIMGSLKKALLEIKSNVMILAVIIIALVAIGVVNDVNMMTRIGYVVGFAQNANQWIVNISIAELQSTGTQSLFLSMIIFLPVLLAYFIRKSRPKLTYPIVLIATLLVLIFVSGLTYQGYSEDYRTQTPFATSLQNDILPSFSLSLGRFATGNLSIDLLLITFLVSLIGASMIYSTKDLPRLSLIITLFLVAVYTTTQGVRFTEFTSGLFTVLMGVGAGLLLVNEGSDDIKKTLIVGSVVTVILIAMGMGMQLGQQLGPDVNSNWDNAWSFLESQTPEFSLVGTWWDPGHMITGIADRRVIADGAHCQIGNDGKPACLYTINDRIVDLGKTMATTDENESLELIRKYQGDSPTVYWIASDDLIGKYRWLQYFGTGCDGVSDASCPLYIQLAQNSQSTDENGNIVFLNYQIGQNSKVVIYNYQIPIPMLVQGIDIALFDEFIVYNGTQPMSVKFSQDEMNSLVTALKPLESQLGARFVNQTIPYTVWMPNHYQYIVLIPPNLRNTVFTRMFMLEGQGLENFKQVFRNEQVKIYEVDTSGI